MPRLGHPALLTKDSGAGGRGWRLTLAPTAPASSKSRKGQTIKEEVGNRDPIQTKKRRPN